jgi:hypothetical protein
LGIPLPAPLGGMLGPDGRNLAVTTEERVRPLYGTGHYGGEGTAHQCYRRGQAYGQAYYRALLYLLLDNSRAEQAVQLLDEWEYALGLPHKPDSWTLAQRQTRIRARLMEPIGSHLDSIEAALVQLCGGYYFALQQPYDGTTPLTYLVQLLDPLTPTCDLYPDIEALLWRMTPAHVQCFLAFPALGIVNYALGT